MAEGSDGGRERWLLAELDADCWLTIVSPTEAVP